MAQSAPRLARYTPLPNRYTALLAALLVLILSGLGMVRDAHSATPSAIPSTRLNPRSQPVALPTAVHGVWHRHDVAGRAQCERYLALPEDIGETDEGWMSMVGSIVITPTLIHEHSEYGEGNFNVVKEIADLGDGSWLVSVQVGFDFIPAADDDLGVDTYRLDLQQRILRWEPRRFEGEHEPGYFRCGDLRADLQYE
ncbi:hypothetical protein [Luteimonas sp. A649]